MSIINYQRYKLDFFGFNYLSNTSNEDFCFEHSNLSVAHQIIFDIVSFIFMIS